MSGESKQNVESVVRTPRHWTLLFVAILLVLGSIVWLRVVAPFVLKIPDNFSYAAQVISHDNFYDQKTQRYSGEQQSATKFSYSAQPARNGALLVDNTFDVRTLSGDRIFSVTRSYGIDAYTGAHVAGFGDHSRNGFLFAPRMKGLLGQVPDKSSFTYWHVNYDVPVTMQFREEEVLYGLPVYRYEANFIADQTKNLTNLPEVGKTRGVTVNVHLVLWIEPYSGYLVQYRDDAEAFYYSLVSGERPYPWNKFYNFYAPASAVARAAEAASIKTKVEVVGTAIPIGLASVAVIVFLLYIAGLILRRWGVDRWRHRSLLWNVLPWATLAVGFGVTIFAFIFLRSAQVRQTDSEFHTAAQEINDAVIARFGIYANALRSGRGLFSASNSVEKDEWRQFVAALDIQKNYPGIQGVGYAPCITLHERSAFLLQAKQQGLDDYGIRPEGEKAFSCPVYYLEPSDVRNQRAVGFDMFSEPVRRAAMEYARDSGDITVSGRVILVQETENDVQPGFLMYEPIYKRGVLADTPEQRRAALQGFVYSPFRVADFMRGVLLGTSGQVSVELFDGTQETGLNKDSLMFKNGDVFLDGKVDTRVVTIGGHSYTLRYTTFDGFRADAARNAIPWITLVFGLLLWTLIGYMIRTLSTRREVALDMAQKMTKDLEKSRDELVETKRELEQKLDETERLNKVMVNRELKMVELKKQLKEIKSNVHES